MMTRRTQIMLARESAKGTEAHRKPVPPMIADASLLTINLSINQS